MSPKKAPTSRSPSTGSRRRGERAPAAPRAGHGGAGRVLPKATNTSTVTDAATVLAATAANADDIPVVEPENSACADVQTVSTQVSSTNVVAADAVPKAADVPTDGDVIVRYCMYSETFQIHGGVLNLKDVDELFCLSDVMPGCFLHLASREFAYGEEHIYLPEESPGRVVGLVPGDTYWCYVQQDAEQEEIDRERMRKAWAGGVSTGLGDRYLGEDKCSCAEGVPCSNQRVCLDWENRFAVAEKGRRPLAHGFAT
eukprot:TRINITY_DN55931_c0_g1_i1.p1 TRINITY_DN55931_c0_g1~~TRINITY_DN55931_c0_g1_i1.p1  ORF type:complete len:256 (+),score=40.95 TRINITY_DN55931_c0_g1_i1:49-816(+)